jgi:cation diffusion facilitator CzcD-associated flavoprotein CzcO
VTAAAFDEGAKRWTIDTEGGERVEAASCIMASGCLSAPSTPLQLVVRQRQHPLQEARVHARHR